MHAVPWISAELWLLWKVLGLLAAGGLALWSWRAAPPSAGLSPGASRGSWLRTSVGALLVTGPCVVLLLWQTGPSTDLLTGLRRPGMGWVDWWTEDLGVPKTTWLLISTVCGGGQAPEVLRWLGATCFLGGVVAHARLAATWLPTRVAVVATVAAVSAPGLMEYAVEGRLHAFYLWFVGLSLVGALAWTEGTRAGRTLCLTALALASADTPMVLLWLLVLAGVVAPGERRYLWGAGVVLGVFAVPHAGMAAWVHAGGGTSSGDALWVWRFSYLLLLVSWLPPASELGTWRRGGLWLVAALAIVWAVVDVSGLRLDLWAFPGLTLLGVAAAWRRWGPAAWPALLLCALVSPPVQTLAWLWQVRTADARAAEASAACDGEVGLLPTKLFAVVVGARGTGAWTSLMPGGEGDEAHAYVPLHAEDPRPFAVSCVLVERPEEHETAVALEGCHPLRERGRHALYTCDDTPRALLGACASPFCTAELPWQP